MRTKLVLGAFALLALSGFACGAGDDKPSTTAAPPASAQEKAVASWAAAAQAYWDDFRNCGSSVTPERGFFATCTKRTRTGFRNAEDRVLRSIRRSGRACRLDRARLAGLMARTGAPLDRAVRAFDRSNDATLRHRRYTGPPPQQLYLRGEQALAEGPPQAKKLSRTIASGC
jgi:hypothetical protein